MKNLTLLLLALLSCIAGLAQDYTAYYQNLPVDVAQVSPISFPDTKVTLTDYGARPDGVTLCTDAFRNAIKDLNEKGGGHLVVPAGVWLTGPIELLSNVDLHLEANALIVFSPDRSLYFNDLNSRVRPAIYATRQQNIGITGSGTIDGNGKYWRPVKRAKVSDYEWIEFKKLGGVEAEEGKLWFPYDLKNVKNISDNPQREEALRADLFRTEQCQGILLEGVTFQNAARFHVHPCKSENIIIDGVIVRCPWNAQNGDGIDLSNCRRCLVVNSHVDVGDDGLCMKSGSGESGVKAGPTADVLITNCTVNHAHGGFVFGSDIAGGMERIVVHACTFSGTDTGLRFKSAPERGGVTKDIRIYDIVMNDIKEAAVTFSCSYVDRKYAVSEAKENKVTAAPYSPEFTDIVMTNVVCRESAVGVFAQGLPDINAVHGIKIKDSTFFYLQDATKIDSTTAQIEMENVNFVTY